MRKFFLRNHLKYTLLYLNLPSGNNAFNPQVLYIGTCGFAHLSAGGAGTSLGQNVGSVKDVWQRRWPASMNTSHSKRPSTLVDGLFDGPSDWIRTSGLLNPIQARYQTSPHPETAARFRRLDYITTFRGEMQAFFSIFLSFFLGLRPSCPPARACAPGSSVP